MSETAVIILNYNGKSCLARCVRTLLASTYEDFSLILVDNASTDGSMTPVLRSYKREVNSGKIVVIQNTENTGFAEGNNIGYRKASKDTKFVVLLNYDAIVPKQWLGEVVRTMREHPELAICGSVIINKAGIKDERDVDVKKELRARAIDKLVWNANTLSMEFGTQAPARYWDGELFDAFFVSGNGMAVRRSMFDTLFNPDYFAYAEDVDICWNARLRGLRVALNSSCYLLHEGSVAKRSDKHLSRVAAFHGTKNQITNILVHYEWKNVLRVWPHFKLTQLAQLAYNPGRCFMMVRAYWWTICHFSRILRYRRSIQATRKTADKEIISVLSGVVHTEGIFDKGFSLSLLHAMNKAALLYCRIVRLHTVEREAAQSTLPRAKKLKRRAPTSIKAPSRKRAR